MLLYSIVIMKSPAPGDCETPFQTGEASGTTCRDIRTPLPSQGPITLRFSPIINLHFSCDSSTPTPLHHTSSSLHLPTSIFTPLHLHLHIYIYISTPLHLYSFTPLHLHLYISRAGRLHPGNQHRMRQTHYGALSLMIESTGIL